MRTIFVLFLCAVFLAGDLLAGERKPVAPSPKDKCPVCGMFVKKYPDWMSQIVFKDGSYVVFDGAKDMFRYYLEGKRYKGSYRLSDIDSVYVTDYYQLRVIDAREATYVLGSDVYGPMGHELIPFARVEDAKEFMKDHRGKDILKFGDITPERLKGLD